MAEERARQLSRVVAGVKDQGMAVSYLRHELAHMPPEEAAAVFAAAAAAGAGAHAESGDLLLWCCVALAAPSLGALRASIAAIVASQGEPDAARMLIPRPLSEQAADEPRVPDFGVGRTLTLGERKSLARRRDRNVLARVLRDPHPDVIDILLRNPALTEPDVIRLSALRPVPAEVLRAVFCAPRWVVRYGVRLALVKNPHAPLDVSLALVPGLRRQDAREVAGASDLDPAVPRAAARLLEPRVLH